MHSMFCEEVASLPLWSHQVVDFRVLCDASECMKDAIVEPAETSMELRTAILFLVLPHEPFRSLERASQLLRPRLAIPSLSAQLLKVTSTSIERAN